MSALSAPPLSAVGGAASGAVARRVCGRYHPGRIPRRLAMTEPVRDLLRAFDALPPAEQDQVAAEILRRWAPAADLPEAVLDELAAELFRGYDAEEAARAEP